MKGRYIMSEVKNSPKSFRIDDETAEKLKEIAQSLGSNHQETFSRLIQTYELEQAKLGVANCVSQIEDIQRYTTAIVNIYLTAVQTNQDLRSTVTEEFNNQIQTKSKTIDQLKEKMDEQAKELKDLSAQVSSLKKEKDVLESKLLEKEEVIASMSKNNSLSDEMQAIMKQMKQVLDEKK